MASAKGFLTVKPEFDTDGSVKSIKIDQAYQKFPASSSTGSVVIALDIEIPDEVFEPAQVKIFVSDDHVLARKPVKVYIVSDEDE